MSNYYTPKIGEFHVEFEYELRNEENAQWGKTTIKEPDDIKSIYDWYDLESTRVKFLDQEDIESFGFTNLIDRYLLKTKNNISYLLFHDNNTNTVSIFVFDEEKDLVDNKYNKLKVKNKSELKKVLQMIGVLEDE